MLWSIAPIKSFRSRPPPTYSVHSRNSRSCVAVAAFFVFFGDSVPTAWRSFADALAVSAWNASSSRQTDGFLWPTRCCRWWFHPSEWLFVPSYVRMLWTYFPTFVAFFLTRSKWTLFPSGRFSQWTLFPWTFFFQLWTFLPWTYFPWTFFSNTTGALHKCNWPSDRRMDGWR